MRVLVPASIAAIIAAIAGPAAAQAPADTPACGPRLVVEYTDEGPDVFLIRNLSGDGWMLEALTIDLTGSAGDLVFDTNLGGEGAGTPSSFTTLPGMAARLVGMAPVRDGGRTLALRFAGFASTAHFTVSLDVDDRLAESTLGRTYVDGPEMAGAHALARFIGPTGQPADISAVFDAQATADSGAGGCV